MNRLQKTESGQKDKETHRNTHTNRHKQTKDDGNGQKQIETNRN